GVAPGRLPGSSVGGTDWFPILGGARGFPLSSHDPPPWPRGRLATSRSHRSCSCGGRQSGPNQGKFWHHNCKINVIKGARTAGDQRDGAYKRPPSSWSQSTKPVATAAAQSTISFSSASCTPAPSGTCISA